MANWSEIGNGGEMSSAFSERSSKAGLTVKCSRRKPRDTENLAFTEATHRALKLGVEWVYRN